MKQFRKWNDLNQFHEVRGNLNSPRVHNMLKAVDYKIPYSFKIKLHGTNACVRIESDGKVVAQKRSSDIPSNSDNAGFRAWVESQESYFATLAQSDKVVYLYGEWCGPGIQSNVACSETKTKMFWVFSVDLVQDGQLLYRYYHPDLIDARLGKQMPDEMLVVPWHSHLTIDFMDPPKTKEALDKLNVVVEAIGEQDPLLKELFDIEGCGEGLVAYPRLGTCSGVGAYKGDEEYFNWFNFKAKSEYHRVNKTKTAVAFDPEKFASVQMFADSYCTEQRLLQAFVEGVEGRKDMRLTPDFIKWVVRDIWKESETEREVSPDLDWKAVSKACSSRAVLWYKAKVQEI